MNKDAKKNLISSLSFLGAFALWTVLLCHVDVQQIGPHSSGVGFATPNAAFHAFTGVHMTLYHVTDWLGLVPFFTAVGFAILGLCQWIRRRSIRKVDKSILALGVFYVLVLVSYLFFEDVVINYRPVLIAGILEASYPSSTTLLVMTVLPTSILQLQERTENARARKILTTLSVLFLAFMVLGRLVCGVHWASDIIGGALLGAGLCEFYRFLLKL